VRVYPTKKQDMKEKKEWMAGKGWKRMATRMLMGATGE
jgi:hypothetical protein